MPLVGQTIQINKTTVIAEMLVIDTDRSIGGQEGQGFVREADEVGGSDNEPTFPAKLAVRLFGADPAIDHVFVMSNAVSVRRPSGWSNEATEVVTGVVGEFLRFYR